MIIKQKGIKGFIKKIFQKIEVFETKEYIEKSRGEKSARKELYDYIFNLSKGDEKIISLKYTELYHEYSKITNINLPRLAKNRNLKTIEMAEELDKNNNSNHVLKLCILAKKLYGAK